MNEVKWIKIDTSIFDNRKIKLIRALPEGDSLVVVWLQLMCLAGTVNDYGRIYLTDEIPYTDEMLATAFDTPLSTVQLALRTFVQFKMIDIIDDVIYISNWEKYQAIEGMEKIREQNRIRKRNQREREKQKLLTNGHVTVTQGHALDIDIDIELEKEEKDSVKKKKDKEIKKQSYPTLEEVEAYCRERNNNVDAKAFYDYYSIGGWKDSKGNTVKNWKQKVITWEKDGRKDNRVPDFTINKQEEPPKRPKEYDDLVDSILKEIEEEDKSLDVK